MREQMRSRLTELRGELVAGEAELAEVEQRWAFLRETLLRISGVVQVMEELLADGHPARYRPEQGADAVLEEAASGPAAPRPVGTRTGDDEQAV